MMIFPMIMPALLMIGGAYATVRLRGFWLLHPIRLCRRLREAGESGGTSPVKALATALAGTLGVGNMAGVATALAAGGAGALFWMWSSAICAMGLKYVEVSLAVLFRRRDSAAYPDAVSGAAADYRGDSRAKGKRGSERHSRSKGSRGAVNNGGTKNGGSVGTGGAAGMGGGEGKAGEVSHAGGAMYYIEALHPGRAGAAVAVLFALLLCLNSLLTGTVVQVSSAVSAFPRLPALWGGAMFAALVLFAAGGGGRRIMSFTASLVPPLTAVFCALSLYIIIRNAALLPAAAREVIRSAFDFSCGDGQRGIFGGILGSSAALSIRYGVTRGIFSNEAGCGTSPTAHAAANTKSPHHQGCFGVFEVFADTIALCSLTAAVLLISPTAGDGIGGTIAAYSYFAGDLAGYVLSASVWLFALATVLCQCYYGMEAAEYLRMKLCRRLSPDDARRIFTWLSAIFCIVGAVIPHGLMWSAADAVISLMTAVNVICILPGIAVAAAELKKTEEKERSTRRLCSGAWSTNRSSKALAPPVRAGRQQDSAAELKR